MNHGDRLALLALLLLCAAVRERPWWHGMLVVDGYSIAP